MPLRRARRATATQITVYNACVRVLISAGEASGEMYGAQLIDALRRQASGTTNETPVAPELRTETHLDHEVAPRNAGEGARATQPQIEFFGVGGEKMRAAGCDLVIDAKDLSVVGITEILGHLPKIWGLFHKLISEADRRRPDLAIVIDSPAFNWRVAREMKKRGVPVVYYVCPQFWAWRQGRVRYLRKYVDKALVIFPFEEKFYRERGVNAEFVGHPLAELPRPAISRAEYAAKHGLDPAKQWITLMPGSRRKEVGMNLPEMVKTAFLFGVEFEYLLPIAPTLHERFIREMLSLHPLEAVDGERRRAGTAAAPSSHPAAPQIRIVPEALPALVHSRAAVVASGTATVEAALMGTPFVMVYRVTPLTYLLGRWTVKVPHFAMVNLIAGERVVPELVQKEFTAERVVAELKEIIPERAPREKMIQGLERVSTLLHGGKCATSAPGKAAEIILELITQRSAGRQLTAPRKVPVSTSASQP